MDNRSKLRNELSNILDDSYIPIDDLEYGMIILDFCKQISATNTGDPSTYFTDSEVTIDLDIHSMLYSKEVMIDNVTNLTYDTRHG